MLKLTLLYAQALQSNIISFNLHVVHNLAASCNQASKTYQDLSTRSIYRICFWLLEMTIATFTAFANLCSKG